LESIGLGVGLVRLVLVLHAAVGAQREALEVERTIGAHVDHAGDAAFDQFRALGFVHVHALQHGGRDVGQLDIAAGGGEHFAAIEHGGDARQATDQDGIRFACVAAHLDAGDAGQGLRHVRVREFADVVGDDGVDDVVGPLLDVQRALGRGAHAAHLDHGNFTVCRLLCDGWDGAEKADAGQGRD
jgi:hypothetical protein